MTRRLPPPWQVEQIDGGFKVLDAAGQALVYVYARETSHEANIAGVLTLDDAHRGRGQAPAPAAVAVSGGFELILDMEE
jgi:hypothetical protein